MIYKPYWMMENMLLREGDSSKRNICKVAASHKGFLRYLQPKSHLGDYIEELLLLDYGGQYHDCEVDFAPPLDYKEPERQAPSVPISKAPAPVERSVPEPTFSAFTGVGRRLDGKSLKHQHHPVSSPASRDKQPGAAKGRPSAASTSQSTRQPQGKLVFGSNVNHGQKETQNQPAKDLKQEEALKKLEPKFQAFTGKKYSLKG